MTSFTVSGGQTLEVGAFTSSGLAVGSLLVDSGGDTSIPTAAFANVDDQGAVTVASGGVLSGYTVDAGATLSVSSGGFVAGGEVLPGGTALIAGAAAELTVDSGAVLSVTGDANVVGLDVLSGGEVDIADLVIAPGADIIVAPTGSSVEAAAPITFDGDSVEAGATLVVHGVDVATSASLTLTGGQLDAPVLVAPGGQLTIDAGAQLNGGGEVLGAATDLGVAEGIAIGSGGVLTIGSGGFGLGEEVDGGGLVTVSSGASLNGALVLGAGAIELHSGGILADTQLDPGASLYFDGVAADALGLQGGQLVLTSGGTVVAQTALVTPFAGERLLLQDQVDGQTRVLAAAEARDDFLGGQQSDLLMQNTDGAVVADVLSGGTESYQVLGGLGPEWSVVGADDFLGEGHAQILIENTAGGLYLADDQGGQLTYADVTNLGSEWSFVGTGDFLGAGARQFMMENTYGSVVVGQITSGAGGRDLITYELVAGLGPEWSFKGVGDYLGDGHDQFLIENTAGVVVVGEVDPALDGGGFQTNYAEVGALGPEWAFEGSGDFLGDGKAQFLIENTAGALVAGELDNLQAQYLYVGGLGTDWSFAGTGDYTGDGIDSFMIRNSKGALVTGSLSSGSVSYTAVGAVGPDWTFHS
ncbi:MAG TPA: hypothetical protein VG248_18655 [Caulobacteraceae bacterium]|jgi:hypothetical protein|nr:hypothetical protein [Caulobacteraceae bacterium]